MEAPDRPVTAETFRSLCRSSHWRWQSLRFEVYWRGPRPQPEGAPGSGAQTPPEAVREPVPADLPQSRPQLGPEPPPAPVRAWLRRPGALRVETLEGTLLESTTGINDSRDDFYVSSTRKSWLLPPHLVTPVYNELQLVRRRPEAAYGEPFYGNPRFAAMLDPVELAGKAPVPFEAPYANPVELESVVAVSHEGRAALEAVLSPNASYMPAVAGWPLVGPGRTAVRIDWQTAVCVWTEALDGGQAGSGHLIRILGVDEYMLDDLFTATDFGLSSVAQHPTYPTA